MYVYTIRGLAQPVTGMLSLLRPYIEQGLVTVIAMSPNGPGVRQSHRWLQQAAATHCTWNVRGRARWAMTWVDLDEFLAYISPPNQRVTTQMSRGWITRLLDDRAAETTAALYFQKRPALVPPGDVPDVLSTTQIDVRNLRQALGKTFVRPHLIMCQALHYPWRIASGSHTRDVLDNFALLHFKPNDWNTWTLTGKDHHAPRSYSFPAALSNATRERILARMTPPGLVRDE